MNDDDVMTLVRESFSGVRAGIPIEKIARRARALRARRRARAVTGAAAMAGTGIAVAAVLTAGQSPPSPPQARLAAWTVTTEANGTVDVTIRQLTDAAGLQRTLRADAIPARVVFYTSANAPASAPGNGEVPQSHHDINVVGFTFATRSGTGAVVAIGNGNIDYVPPQAHGQAIVPPLPPGCQHAPVPDRASVVLKIVGAPGAVRGGVVLTFHPASIPSGAALYLSVDSLSSSHSWGWTMDLVKDGPSCMGA
jgi:hypothetical protein